MHHDESLHGTYAYRLYEGKGYRHDPMMHGPFLFHITALLFGLLGDSDYTVRVAPAMFGVLIVAFPWLLRKWIGKRGALFASFLTLISPTILYFSRFARHDIFAVFWTAVIVYAVGKYLDEGRERWLTLLAGGLAMIYVTKEVAFLLSGAIWSFLLIVAIFQRWQGWGDLTQPRAWHLVVLIGALLAPLATALVVEVFFGRALGLGWKALDYSSAGLGRSGLVFSVLFMLGVATATLQLGLKNFAPALFVFYAIFIVFHTTFLTNSLGIPSGFVGALGYWLGQQGVNRGDQPWYYYFLLLWLYEYLALALSAVGGGLLLLRGVRGEVFASDGRIQMQNLFPLFLLWWLVFSFFAYSAAGEKMPWLSVHMTLPATWLAAWALGYFLDPVNWCAWGKRVVAWTILVLTTLASVATIYHAWLASYEHADIASEMLIYTQTTPDVLTVTSHIQELSRRLTGGRDIIVAYDNETSWPFEWYLRHFPNRRFFAANPSGDIAGVPVVLAGRSNEERVRSFIPNYISGRYRLRWWFPEKYKELRNPKSEYDLFYFFQMALNKIRDPQDRRSILDFVFWRRLREPLGSTEFVMYVRPDLVKEMK